VGSHVLHNDEAMYQRLLDDIREEFPGFRVVKKSDSPLQRAIDRAQRVISFGAIRHYLDCYQTTIGQVVYVTDDWDRTPALARTITMRHERVHLRQFRRYTFLGMAFLYLLVPLPAGLSWFRAHFEKEGYAETIRATAELQGYQAVTDPRFRAYVIRQFVSGAYGWMWPFRRSMERWYDDVLSAVRAHPAKEQRAA
jgi:hypothetical protein